VTYPAGTYGSFFADELRRIDAPRSHRNFVALLAWAIYEGTGCDYNPQATTQDWPGARACNPIVKAYPDEGAGVGATVETLGNGYYGAIVRALRLSDRPRITCRAISSSPWGSHPGIWHIVQARLHYSGYLTRRLPPNGSPI
jgi:hypothetical protein